MGTCDQNEPKLDQSLLDLCERTVAMNLLQCYQTTSVDEMNCEEWGNGTEQSKTVQTVAVDCCGGCIELRREVHDLKTAMHMILPMLPMYAMPNQLATAAGLVAPQSTIQNVLHQSLLRNKRPTAQTPTVPQAECPVSMRTVLQAPTASALQNAFLLNQWMMTPTIKPPSPTLPTGSLPAAVGESQLASTDDQPVKWSSPSSVDSNGQKTDSSAASAGDTQTIDIIGDGSESPTSSTHSAQDIAIMAAQQSLVNAFKDSQSFLFNPVPQADTTTLRLPAPTNGTTGAKPATGGPERKPRKPVNDDIVKIVRGQDLSEENIATFEIPVPKALESDPNFRPVSEQQIIQQIIQGKKYEEMEVGECMIQLCKKLAEKRVFGPRLMSQTTVAGLNHSNYSNLPIKGICYIQHVCKKVLYDKFEHEEDFWDKFREAMRKLAARCRRVRHAKKTKTNREEAQAEMLSKRFGEDIPFNIALNGQLRPKIEPVNEQPTDIGGLSISQIHAIANACTRAQPDKPRNNPEYESELLNSLIVLVSRATRSQEQLASPTVQ